MKKVKNVFSKILLPILAIIMVVGFVLMVTGCDSITQKLSDLTGVKYENGKITWDKVASAKEYDVVVDGNSNKVSASDNSYELTDVQNVENVEIKALDDSGNVIAEGAFYVLPQMEVEIIDGNFDWTRTSYDLDRFANKGYTVTYEVVYDGELKDSKYSKTTYPAGQGSHRIKVRGILSGTPNNVAYYSNYSIEVTSKTLATPDSLDVKNGILSWTPVDFMDTAVNYTVIINGVVYNNVTTSYIDLTVLNITTSLTVSVQAISSEAGILDGVATKEYSFKQVDKIQTVSIKDGVVSWNEIEDAKGYRIEINGIVLEEILDKPEYQIIADGTVMVRVRAEAEADITYGLWSEPAEFTILSTPVPRFDDSGILVWDSIAGAESYTVLITRVIDGELDTESATEVYAKGPSITVGSYCKEEGVYNLKVKANPRTTSELNSSRYSVTKEVVRLGAPKTYKVSETIAGSPGGSVIVSITDVSAGAKYVMKVDGTEVSSTTGTTFVLPKPLVTFVDGDAKSVKVEIFTEAMSRSENNGKIYLSSKESLIFYFDQLSAPEKVYLTVNAEGENILKWNANSYANGYGIVCGSKYASNNNEFTMLDLTPGIFELKVFARGDLLSEIFDDNKELIPGFNDSNTYGKEFTKGSEQNHIRLSSEYSYTINVKKLALPNDFEVIDGTFTWDSVQGATGYKCQYLTTDGGVADYNYNPGDPLFDGKYLSNYAPVDPSIITPNGVILKVKALGNAIAEEADEDSSMVQAQRTIILDSDWEILTSKAVLLRLDAPTGFTYQGSNLIWNTVENASYYRILTNVNNDVVVGITTNTTFSLEGLNLAAGEHIYSIQAMGNNQKFFDSEVSEQLTITRLKQPEISVRERDNCYVWNYEEGVVRYKITIQGGTSSTNSEIVCTDKNIYKDGCEITYVPEFTGYDNPIVTIVTIANEANFYMKPENVSFVQPTKTMSAPVNPDINCKVNPDDACELIISTSAINELGTGFVFVIANVNNPLATEKYTEGENEGQEKNYVIYRMTSAIAGSVDIKVGFKANIFHKEANGEFVYYLDSPLSIENAKVIYFLAPATLNTAYTQNPDIQNPDNIKCTVSWLKSDRSQFLVSYKVVDADGVEVEGTANELYLGQVAALTFDLDADLFDGNHKLVFSVTAIGNDIEGIGTIISSTTDTHEYVLSKK